MDDATRDRSSIESLPDPAALTDRDGVEVSEWPLAVEQERFDALEDRYEPIDGDVVVGVTNDEGEVLLQGIDAWSPPGGPVEPSEDWVAAARRRIEALTGEPIEIDYPERLERIEYCLEGAAAESRFTATTVYFGASLVENGTTFLEAPTVADDFDHEHLDDVSRLQLGWFDGVPPDAHPNYADAIELYLD